MLFVQAPLPQRVAAGANALAFGNPNVAGNTLFAAIMIEDDTSTITSVVSGNGNTWQPLGTLQRNLATHFSAQWYVAKNCAAGIETITVTPSAGSCTVHLLEESGPDHTSPLDGVPAQGAGSGTTTAHSGTLTTAVDNELLLAFIVSNRPITAGVGYEQRTVTDFNLNSMTQDQIAEAPGSYDATGTLSVAGSYVAILAAFTPAAVAGGAASHRNLSLMGIG